MPTATSTVTTLYEEIDNVTPSELSYAASTADITTFASLLGSGQITIPTLIADIENSAFTQGVVDPIIREYQAAFGRVPDQAGLAYWVGQVATGAVALSNLGTIFANSAEFAARYGGANASTVGNDALVTAFYENTLGRAPDPAGLAYWLSTGDTAAELLNAFSQSAEFISDTVADVILFQNSEANGTPLAPTVSLLGLIPYALPHTAVDVNGYQNVTADLTPYIYNGVGPTLVNGDVITNVGTLTITDEYGAGTDIIPAGATLENIANIILDTAGNAGSSTGSPFNVAGITGVETLTVNSSGAHYDFVEAAQTTDITVNHGSTLGGVVSLGGDDVTISSNGDGYVSVGLYGQGIAPSNAALLPAGAVTITYNGDGFSDFTQSGIYVAGGTSVTVDINATNSEAFVSIGNTPTNTGDFVGALASATNPTGPIVVVDNAVYGGEEDVSNNAWIEIFGGTSVTVTAHGEAVVIGDPYAVTASNESTGAITVTDLAPYIWSGDLTSVQGQEEDVYITTGSSAPIAVESNTGDVTVGDYFGLLNAASTAALAGTLPMGTVTVVDTATDQYTYVGVFGGSDVTINGPSTIADADIQVGEISGGVAIAPTGTITVYDEAKVAWGGTLTSITTNAPPTDVIPVGDTGIGHTIEVLGGTDVAVTTNTAAVTVGSDTGLGDPTGTVTVVDTATAEVNGAGYTDLNDSATTSGGNFELGLLYASVQVYGGTDVSVTASGMDVTVGAPGAAPTGTVTVVDMATATLAYDDLLSNYDAVVSVLGGTDISVTTNVGDVYVGDGGTATTGTEPTGTITVIDDSTGYVDINGGTDVTVTSWGGYIQVGDGANSANSPLTNPTGTVTATMTAVETGWLWDTSVKIEGAGVGDAVTVHTTGGNVYVGTDWLGANITDVSATPVTGAVVIDDTYGGITQDDIAVMGGTTVTINISASDHDFILVGSYLNPLDDPTGNVVINDSTVVGPDTIYGKEGFGVITDGATSVSITGGAGSDNYIGDFQSYSVGGTPIGTATLADISLTGFNGVVEIGTNALSDLTVADSNWSLADIYNDTLNSSLTLNLANDANFHLYDEGGFSSASVYGTSFISTLTVDVTGAAPSELTLYTPGLTTLNIDDTAGLNLGFSWPGLDLDSLTTINISGSGTTNLGPLFLLVAPSVTDINASAATGAVLVGIDPTTTAFTGGSGANVVALWEPVSSAVGAPVIDGGSGGHNTLYALYTGDSATQTPLGATVNVENFHTLGVALGGGSFDASGFAQLDVGAYSPYPGISGYFGVFNNVTFTDVAQGASLDLIDPSDATITYELGKAFTTPGYLGITIGQDGNVVTGTAGVIGIGTATVDLIGDNISSVSISSQGDGISGFAAPVSNELAIIDPYVSATDPGLTSLTITGDQSLYLLATDTGAITVINASGTSGVGQYVVVNVGEDLGLNPNGVAVIGGAAEMFVSGGATGTAGVDTFTLGSGGGIIGLGAGGAGYEAGKGTATGSETINLDAAAPNGTIVYAQADIDGKSDGAYGVVNGWTLGTIGSGQTADAVALTGAVVIGNETNVLETDGAKYNVSDGVITLATGSTIPSASQELFDAESILAAYDGGVNGEIAMVTVEVANGSGGETLATFLIQHEGSTSVANKSDVFVELPGVSGITGFGVIADDVNTGDPANVGGGTSVSLTDISGYDALFANVTGTAAATQSASANQTNNDAGDALDTVVSTGAGHTYTYASLGNFAILEADTGGSGIDGGNVVVTQVGVDPILVLSAQADVDLTSLTYGNASIAHDDPSLLLYAENGTIDIGSLVDASGTGTTIAVAGSNWVEIGSITDAGLKVINAASLDANFELGYENGTGGASQAGLTIIGSLSDTGPYGNTIVASGKGDVISIGSAFGAAADAYQYVVANGAGDAITVIGGYYPEIAAPGAGDVITVAGNDGTAYVTGLGDDASYTAAGNQLGAGDTLNVGVTPNPAYGIDGSSGDVHAWLGANSTVNIYDGSDADLHLLGDTAGTSLTGMTTINEVDLGHLRLHLDEGNGAISTEAWAGGSLADSQVNVASATSLASALNIAAGEALRINGDFDGFANTTVAAQNTLAAVMELDGHTGLVDWFDYGGNTYVVEVNNAGAAAAAHGVLESGDIVIKFTGIVDLGHHTDFALI